MEDSQKSLELIHLDLQHLELIQKDLFKPNLHNVLKDSISILFIHSLNVEIAG